VTYRSPHEIMEEIAALDVEGARMLANIRTLLRKSPKRFSRTFVD